MGLGWNILCKITVYIEILDETHTDSGGTMDEKKFFMMNIASNILSAYYSNKVSFCLVNKHEPSDIEKQDILKRTLSMFENLSTSYLDDIREIAENIK